MAAIAEYLGGFWSPQTPVSFLAGVGATDIIRRVRDYYATRQDQKDDSDA